jgi:hypothetical protein
LKEVKVSPGARFTAGSDGRFADEQAGGLQLVTHLGGERRVVGPAGDLVAGDDVHALEHVIAEHGDGGGAPGDGRTFVHGGFRFDDRESFGGEAVEADGAGGGVAGG